MEGVAKLQPQQAFQTRTPEVGETSAPSKRQPWKTAGLVHRGEPLFVSCFHGAESKTVRAPYRKL